MIDRRPWLSAAAIAAALAGAYLVWSPWSTDLAAHVFRAELFQRDGFTLWNGWWYAGHHTLGYSVLFPPLAALLGPRLAGALAAVAAAALFAAIARRHFGERAWIGSAWFAVGTATLLLSGRLTFALGVAVGLGALLAYQQGHRWVAAALAVGCGMASPVAAIFLAIAGLALAFGDRRRDGVLLAAVALIPLAVLAILFPEGGSEPFAFSAYWPIPLLALAAVVLLEPEERVLRTGAVIYAACATLAFVIATPLGGNVTRLGALAAGPIFACALWPRRRFVLVLVALPLVYWQWTAAVRDVAHSEDDPSVHAVYYQPLLNFLASHDDRPMRVEIPFTRLHWEAARVAPDYPLARGWERQLDRKYNTLFYRGRLTATEYHAWLDSLGVRFVALPDVELDRSAQREAQLIRSGLPFLRPVWRSEHWRVWEVRGARPIVEGPARVTDIEGNRIELNASAAGVVTVRMRFTPVLEGRPGRGLRREDRRRLDQDRASSAPGRSSSSPASPPRGSTRAARAARSRTRTFPVAHSPGSMGLSPMPALVRTAGARLTPNGWLDLIRQLRPVRRRLLPLPDRPRSG